MEIKNNLRFVGKILENRCRQQERVKKLRIAAEVVRIGELRSCGSWCEVQGSVQQYKRKAKDKLFKEEL